MNNIHTENGILRFAKAVLNFFLLSKQYSFIVGEQPQVCAERLWRISQPRTGLLNAVSREVKIVEDGKIYRFEICVLRYGRGLSYNSVKATGTIASLENEVKKITLSGEIRLGLMFLGILWFFLAVLFTRNPNSFVRTPGWYALAFAISLFYLIRTLKDYGTLFYLIRDTFSEEIEPTKA